MANTFSLSRGDFAQFQTQVSRVIRKSVPRSWGFLLQMSVWIFIGLAVSTYLRLYESAFDYRRSIAIVGGLIVLAAVAFVLGQVVAGRLLQKHLLRDGGSLLSPQTIALDDDGVDLVTLQGLGTARYSWPAFIGRTEDERNMYLFLEPSYGIIIPKTAIAGPGEGILRGKVREL